MSGPGKYGPAEGFDVLIVDDEPQVRLLMKNVVSRLGGTVVALASDGEEAVEAFRAHRPGLVLLDIQMPVREGIEVLEQIRQEAPETRVIILTGKTDRDTVERCLSLGARAYIRKDTLLSDLVDSVKAAIRGE